VHALRRIVYRALVVGLGEELLALALVPSQARGTGEAGYPLFALFLGVPAALVTGVELLADREPLRRSRLATWAVAAAAALAGILAAHFQAVYATAFLQTRSLPDGVARAWAQWDELFVTGTSNAASVLGVFFFALAFPFAVASMFSQDRRASSVLRTSAYAVTTIVVALWQEVGRIYWNDRTLEHAAVVVSLSVPVLFALADALERRRAQADEQNAT